MDEWMICMIISNGTVDFKKAITVKIVCFINHIRVIRSLNPKPVWRLKVISKDFDKILR